jgi:hypothetical protein
MTLVCRRSVVVLLRCVVFFCTALCKAHRAHPIVLARARDTQNQRVGRSFCVSRAKGAKGGLGKRRIELANGGGQETVIARALGARGNR